MKIETKPADIFREYESGVAYNNSIDLYETVRRNERFYIGRQWEGLNAPDLDKPVLNFLKRVCSYLVAMLVSDDIAAQITPFKHTSENNRLAEALTEEIGRVLERTKAKTLMRELLRNCVVDGDGCFYWYFDTDGSDFGGVRGEIALELIDNTRVLFGNPFEHEAQKQPYIILVKREQMDAVRERARRYGGHPGDIRPDDDSRMDGEDGYAGRDLVTVLVKLYKEKGRIYFTEVTRGGVVRPVTETPYTLYPLCYMNWERVKHSYHGQAVLTGLIPNQIAVNKLWAMAIHHLHTLAFPKVFYDRLRIKEWNNRVGEAIGVAGSPDGAVASSFRAGDMSPQLVNIVEKTIAYTKEFMGASDAMLGNIRADNAAAIVALQKSTAVPLEIQRLAFYQFVEDCVRVIADMIFSHYGPRTDSKGQAVDFSGSELAAMSVNVEVGASAYWSELTQLGTLDNLFANGVLTDALLYLENLPDRYIRNKPELIRRLKESAGTGKEEKKHEMSFV